VPVKQAELTALGSQPLPDSVVHARLLTELDSASAKLGQEVKAVVNAPLFSPDHKLVYPEGTLLTGAVVLAKRARSFHRPGQLRFNFQKVELPQEVLLVTNTKAVPALADPHVQPVIETNSVMALLAAVQASQLVAVLPGALVSTVTGQPGLEALPLVDPDLRTPIGFMSAAAARPSHALAAALRLAAEPAWIAEAAAHSGPLRAPPPADFDHEGE